MLISKMNSNLVSEYNATNDFASVESKPGNRRRKSRMNSVPYLNGCSVDHWHLYLYKNHHSNDIIKLRGMQMKKSLTSIGGSLGLIIDKAIADLYGIDRTTEVEITPMQDGLSIRFLKDENARATGAEVSKAGADVQKRYGKMMRRLAK